MSQWYITFDSVPLQFIKLIESLIESNIEVNLQLNGKKIDVHKIDLDKNQKFIRVNWSIFSHIYDKKLVTTISICGADSGLSNEALTEIKVTGEALKPSRVSIEWEEKGTKPQYEGKWDFEHFKKVILPKIERDK